VRRNCGTPLAVAESLLLCCKRGVETGTRHRAPFFGEET
jgi:hypothetical protein